MPSLFKYFLTVGGVLIGLLFLTNYLLEQPAPASAENAGAPKAAVAVKTDPQASRVERWRAEQAAAEVLRKEEAARVASQPAEPEAKPAAAKAANAAAQPVGSRTKSAAQTADVSMSGTETTASTQAKVKSRKVARTEKPHNNKRMARDDARYAARTGTNQQDDYYYGQRQGYAQQQGFGQRTGYAPAYAYAPQQSFGPFGGGGGGGWGRGW